MLVVVGDAMARPLLDELEADPGRYDLSSLLAVGSGGAVLSPSTKRRLSELLPGRALVDGFGSSETGQLGGAGTGRRPLRRATPARRRAHGRARRRPAPGGPGVRPGGAAGPQRSRPASATSGIPSKSATTFVTAGGRRWALPGDQATVEADGIIVVLGRGSLCINTGGEKVFPDEVEAVLKGAAEVGDAVVVGVPDELLGERVVAVVAARPGHTLDGASLRDHCRRELAGYKVPRQVVVTDEVVRSPSGKPDYRWARAFAADALADTDS